MAHATNNAKTAENSPKRPIQTIRYGVVRAAIWKRLVDLGNNSRPMYSVTFTRSYKDADQWRESASFGPDDLLTLAKIANEAHTFIHQDRHTSGPSNEAAERQGARDK
jgi:hypothetical protein